MQIIVSKNACIFKPLAVICIATGHFIGNSEKYFNLLNYWWILDTISLIYFSICSAYFTNIKYENYLNIKEFWRNKIGRLGIKLIVINLFLLVVFLLRKNENIFSLHSVVNMIGMGGLLNWINIKNISPFGAGTWFLTVLLLFYALYPFLRSVCLTKYFAYLFAVIVIALLVLDRNYYFGYMLWLTVCGYFVGLYFSKDTLILKNFNIKRVLFSIFFILFSLLILNYFKIKFLNGLLLLLLGSLLFMLTFFYDFSYTFLRCFIFFNYAVFEIYMIHQYFLSYKHINFFVNLIISALVFLSLSLILAYISRWVTNQCKKIGSSI